MVAYARECSISLNRSFFDVTCRIFNHFSKIRNELSFVSSIVFSLKIDIFLDPCLNFRQFLNSSQGGEKIRS